MRPLKAQSPRQRSKLPMPKTITGKVFYKHKMKNMQWAPWKYYYLSIMQAVRLNYFHDKINAKYIIKCYVNLVHINSRQRQAPNVNLQASWQPKQRMRTPTNQTILTSFDCEHRGKTSTMPRAALCRSLPGKRQQSTHYSLDKKVC